MAREITSLFKAQLTEEVVYPIFLLDLEWSDGHTYNWTGIGDLTWDGETWQGLGTFGAIAPVLETDDTMSTGAIFTLTGIPLTSISNVLSQAERKNDVICYMAFINSDRSIVSDPYVMFKGKMDTPTLEITGATATIQLASESRLAKLQMKNERRYTQEDQQEDFPSDKGLNFIDGLQDKTIHWGRPWED